MLEVKLVVVGGATEGDEFQLELPAVLGRSRDRNDPIAPPPGESPALPVGGKARPAVRPRLGIDERNLCGK